MSMMNIITEKFSHLTESVKSQTLIEILGVHRVLVEYHQGIMIYGHQKIEVATSFGKLIIVGTQLRLQCISREKLCISGDIQALVMERDDR